MFHYKFLLYLYVFLLNVSNVYGNCLDVDTKKPNISTGILENTYVLILVVILAWIFLLLLLGALQHPKTIMPSLSGIIKGLIGLLCCPRIGLCGLSVLTDLPVPLEQYYEPELKKLQVQYDLGAWAVHPFTNERTVRILPKTTELFLNSIFFLAYPLTVCEELCMLCCSKGTTDSDNESVCYQSITTIRLVEEASKTKNQCRGPVIDMYYDDDKENEDTQYVLNQLQESKESLKKINGMKNK